MYTPRPTVGKKKAKALLSNSSDATNKNKKQKMVAVLENEKIIACHILTFHNNYLRARKQKT